ncbi:nuclease-related domain-containing protein [uncultured Pseudacidovorax sp.]|uniref:nuclease-related domain-containing protein n=1 Tax=uncultured Pseudacidovorax sp. TaxID=679313 RepID=UPI0025EAF867|nr:nuclease-related domain-containing protein [uncultured Pseudacidovorax sp.]
MLLKKADDKSKRVTLLMELQKSPLLDERQRSWLRDELEALRKGIDGERDAAFHLDSYFKDSATHVLMHDLRFEIEGDVAQIDHMLINRAFDIYLFETKNYGGNLSINSQGEFTASYGNRKFGVPSPLEQSRRHARVLDKLLDRLNIAPRTGSERTYHHVVLMHPRAIIQRPPTAAFDTSAVIKADMISSWHGKFVDGFGVAKLMRVVVNLRHVETIREWAEMLIRQHRPADLLRLPPFMTPRQGTSATAASAVAAPAMAPNHETATTADRAIEPAQSSQARKLVCAHCGAKISFAEGRFCWNNAQRFGGLQYCRADQGLF